MEWSDKVAVITEITRKKMTEAHLLNVYEWLQTTDFFTAPASIHYHGVYPGGLLIHSYQVYLLLREWSKRLDIQWERDRSPLVIGLLHDVCKIGAYEKITTEDGRDVYVYNKEHDRKYEDNHGLLSVQMLTNSGLIQLTDEERICIRYHMGTFTRDLNPDLGDLSYSEMLNKYPNLLWTHTADMYASQIMKN